MKVIKAELPESLKYIELHVFADEHMGDPLSDLDRLKQRIDYVKNNPNAYCVLNGDIIDNATKTSIGDSYEADMNPMKQLQTAVELFEPIKHKILAITHGNHENRTYKTDGINLSELLARQLGLYDVFSPTTAYLFIRLGAETRNRKNSQGKARKVCYTVFMTHGSGGGRTEGAKANKLVGLSNIADSDIYIRSHVHAPMVLRKKFYRVNLSNSSIQLVERLFVSTASNLDYGGYGEVQEYTVSSKQSPIIILDGTKKDFYTKS